MKQNSIKALSIQIRLSGLSFCILNRTNNSIEIIEHIDLDKKATPYELLNELKLLIESKSEFNQEFDSVLCIYQNELSCLVPKELFDENNMADYLKFNAKILKTDFINYDNLPVNDSVNIYVPLININNYIFETFGSFDYKHASTILIESLLQRTYEDATSKVFINVNTTTFEIVVIKNKELEFYNTFDYTTKEDFIYYILFTIEQLKLNPEIVKTYLMGQINEDDQFFKILYRYIRFVEFLKSDHRYATTNNQDHNNFVLINSFS
ncbi:DUF3822 family protein [Psychroserpens sp. Hel_I_66]|uniref:DUF3822 family protein n=1 Tax=Psychroserpens sp. Hel_I_66 TaxID=1250004 RepID=UPI00064751C6|nr:DUF3822 family protein [Psychroserpens sp. Hel_I_66]